MGEEGNQSRGEAGWDWRVGEYGQRDRREV